MKEAYWIEKFSDYLRLIRNRSTNTARAYCADALMFSRFLTCDTWAEVTEETAGSYVQHLRENGSKDGTIARRINSLKAFFTYLRRQHVLQDNPFVDVAMSRYEKPLPNPLTVDEMTRFLGAIREPLDGFMGLPTREVYLVARDKALFETMYGCGLRVSELCGMNWGDIDWAARELRVLGKGSKVRIVPLGQYAIDALLIFSRHYEHCFRKKAEGHQPVFISQHNRRINQRSICRPIKKWAKAAGITRHINPHAFRHSCAQHMLDGGADLRAVQTLLGHARIQTTEIYTSVSTRKLKSIHGITHPRA